MNTLYKLSNKTPTAKSSGVIDRVEVFYNGDRDDMSPTLKELTLESDKTISRRQRSFGKPAFNGDVKESYRDKGSPLLADTAAIRFYITSELPSGEADKGVFAHQMKTIHSEVLNTTYRTIDGDTIDAVFGYKSIQARTVGSPEIVGTTTTLLCHIGKQSLQFFMKELQS